MQWELRAFETADRDSVFAVVAAAFGRSDEALLVERLRASEAWLSGLALVATGEAGSIHGFSAMTRISVADRPALALAPVAVSTASQRQGIGSELVREGIARAARLEERLVLVLGNPAYYGRFGFVPAIPLGIHSPYDKFGRAFQALVLPGDGPEPTGLARYPDAFGGL